MNSFRAFLVSKAGRALAFVVSALVASLLGWCAAHAPWLHVEMLVMAAGCGNFEAGQVVVSLAIMGALRESISWAVAHWARLNIDAVKIIQEALNQQLGTDLKTDGLLQQQTGIELNKALGSNLDLPVEKLSAAAGTSLSKIAALFLVLLALGLNACAHLTFTVPIPIGKPEDQWRIAVDLAIVAPPSLYSLVDAPAGLGLRDFKAVLQ